MPATVTFDSEWYRILSDLRTVKLKADTLERDFIDIASQGIILVLKENTPKNTGDAANSWKIFSKGKGYFIVGSDMPDLMIQLTEGVRAQTIFAKNGKAMHFFIGGEEFFRQKIETRGTIGDEFIEPIVKAMDIMIQVLLLSLMQKHWKIFKDIGAKRGITAINLSKTVGLTGTKRNARRGRGGGIQKAKTGRKSFKRTLSRRRRTGNFLTSKKAVVNPQ